MSEVIATVIAYVIFYGFIAFFVLKNVLTLYYWWKEYERQGRVTLKLVGIKYRTEADYERYLKLKPGEKVLLEKEPDNPKDEYAVKVVTMDGYHIGYISASETYYLHRYPNKTYIGRFYRYDPEKRNYHYVRFYAKDNGIKF